MIKGIDEQPDEEIYWESFWKISSAEASVPVKLGVLPFWYKHVFTHLEVP